MDTYIILTLKVKNYELVIHNGAFTYDVSKILANFTPPLPLSATFSIERPPLDDVSICQTPPPHFKVT